MECFSLGDLISVGDAAREKQVTPQAIYASIKKDQLPCVKFKGRIYLMQASFDAIYTGKYSRSKLQISGERVFDDGHGRISVREAANRLGVTVQRVYYAIKHGAIKSEKRGKTWVVLLDPEHGLYIVSKRRKEKN